MLSLQLKFFLQRFIMFKMTQTQINRQISNVSSTIKLRMDAQKKQQMRSFHHIFQQIKKEMKISRFISNISKNNVYSRPVEYKLDQMEPHLVDWKGWETNWVFQNVILMLDIIFTLANFTLSTFEAFLDGYQQFKIDHPYIISINIIAVIIYLLKTILSLGTQDVEHGVHYIYLTDIIRKEILKIRFHVQVLLAVIIIINMASGAISDATSQTVAIIYFVLCIAKLYNLSFSLFKLELMFVNTLNKARYWNLTKVFIINILFAHFMASIFLAMLKMNKERNWYDTKSQVSPNPSWFELYLWALYWSCTTMITVGYGDFVPAIVEEAVIVSALEILSSIVIAYNISQIGSIILSINQSAQAINAKIGLLRRMNNENTVSMGLNLIMEEYLIHEAKIQEEFEYAKHRQLISSMPQQLQYQYYGEAQKNIFRKIPFFTNLSSQILTSFFLQSQGKVYYPGQFIIQKNFVQQISIILKGEVGYCYRKFDSTLNGTIIQKMKIDYSKDCPFLIARNVLNKNEGIYFDIKATKYSYSIKLSTQIFLEILKENEIDYHYYLMNLDYHQAKSTLTLDKCQYCRYDYHTKFQCPKLHYVPLKSIVLSRHNHDRYHGSLQHRKKIKIRKNRSRHPYTLKKKLSIENVTETDDDGFNRTIQMQYLKLVIISYGDKKAYQNVPNRAAKDIFKNTRIFEMNNDGSDALTYEADEMCDFHHYFTKANPSKLIHLPLTKKNRSTKGAYKSISQL